MHSRTLILVMVLAALGSLFFLAQPDPPEMIRAESSDGLARVEALVQQGGGVRLRDVELRIRQEEGGPATARVSPVYEIVRNGGYGELGGTFLLASDLDPASHALGYWDSNDGAWRIQSTSVYERGRFSSGTLLPQTWALFQQQDVEISHRYEQIVAELIANRPEKTKRATIRLSYAFEPEDYVRIRSARVTAACGGNLQAPRGPREGEEVVESAVLSINGHEREGWIRARAVWELEDGCAEGEVFELVE